MFRSLNNKPFGIFSLSKYFINDALKKDKYSENSFSFLDVIINRKGVIKTSHLEIEKSPKERLKEISNKQSTNNSSSYLNNSYFSDD